MTVSPQARFRIGIVLLTLIAYALIWKCGFVNLDDPEYVSNNPEVKTGLLWDNVRWAWTTDLLANWHPLTWMSLMLDATVYSPGPLGFHLTNLLFHIANALLLFEILRRMTGHGNSAGCVALLFALHPVHVESVAWISERKDVLSTFFGLLSLLTWLRYTQSSDRATGKLWYALVLVTLLCSLLSKQLFVTFPCLLLLLDVWPLRRFNRGDAADAGPPAIKAIEPHPEAASEMRGNTWLLVEKLPIFLLTVGFAVMVFLFQKLGGAMEGMEHLSLDVRLCNAAVSYVDYLRTLFWPVGLACFYPHPEDGIPQLALVVSCLSLGLLTATAASLWKRAPYVATGWFWFVGTLVPMIGVVQVGMHQRADRYLYLPAIGIYIVMVWAARALVVRLRATPRLPAVAMTMAILLLVGTTFLQVGRWRDSVRLWTHAVEVTDRNLFAYIQLANAYDGTGRLDESAAVLREGLELWPNSYMLNANYGLYFIRQGESEQALPWLRQGVRLQPENGQARALLGLALWKSSELAEAEEVLKQAIEQNPRWVRSYYWAGRVHLEQGQTDAAREFFERALEVDPTYEPPQNYLTAMKQGVPLDSLDDRGRPRTPHSPANG